MPDTYAAPLVGCVSLETRSTIAIRWKISSWSPNIRPELDWNRGSYVTVAVEIFDLNGNRLGSRRSVLSRHVCDDAIFLVENQRVKSAVDPRHSSCFFGSCPATSNTVAIVVDRSKVELLVVAAEHYVPSVGNSEKVFDDIVLIGL